MVMVGGWLGSGLEFKVGLGADEAKMRLGRNVGMGWGLGWCVGDYGNEACSTWLELPFQRGEPEMGWLLWSRKEGYGWTKAGGWRGPSMGE